MKSHEYQLDFRRLTRCILWQLVALAVLAALLQLAAAPAERLTQRVYNVTSFSLSAAELKARVRTAFPKARITFAPDVQRARIVDSWPEDVDDSPARRDWNWKPDYEVNRAFDEYLIPEITRHYKQD